MPDQRDLVLLLVSVVIAYGLRRILDRVGTRFRRRNIHEHAAVSEGHRFIVFNPMWPDPPRFAFGTLAEAKKTAEKLGRKQPKDEFFVMKAVLRISAVPQTTELPGGDI